MRRHLNGFPFGLVTAAAFLGLLLPQCKTRSLDQEGSLQAVIAPGSKDDPYRYFPEFKRNIAQLPTSGQVPPERMPWVDTYWPTYRGGMAVRWFGGTPQDGGTYALRSREEILALAKTNPEVLKTLSPVEKYDIFMGRYDYPTVRFVNATTGPERIIRNPDGTEKKRERVASWEGFCHGWAAAAIVFPEPKPVVGINPEGISIPFGSSDIKALLTLHQGHSKPMVSRPDWWDDAQYGAFIPEQPDPLGAPERPDPVEKFIGERCRSKSEKFLRACTDINAGTFHVMLANKIGLQRVPFVYNGASKRTEIWNFPVFSYDSQLLREEKPSWIQKRQGISKVVVFQTTVRYAAETDPNWEPMNGTPLYKSDSKIYTYELEMDDFGNILGGKWKIGSQKPDFLWVQDPAPFQGAHWQGLARLIGR